MLVRSIGDRRSRPLDGYVRGLCVIGDALVAATSIRRRASRRTGELLPLDDVGQRHGRCALYQLNRHSFDVERMTDPSRYADEIYDLLPIVGTERWPVLSELEQRNAVIARLTQRSEAASRIAEQAVTNLHRQAETVVNLQQEAENLREEIGYRETIIANLQEQLAGSEAVRQATIANMQAEITFREAAIANLQGELTRQLEENQRLKELLRSRDPVIAQPEAENVTAVAPP